MEPTIKTYLMIVLLALNTLWATENETNTTQELSSTLLLELKGTQAIEKSAVYDALGAEYPNKFMFWKKSLPTLQTKLIAIAPASLRAFYDSEGFYDANFTIEANETTVQIVVDENTPVVVEEMNITSDYDITPFVLFQKGDVFRAKDFIKSKSNIVQSLLNDGYCSYDFNSKAYVDLEKKVVKLHYTLSKGGVCSFGNVTVRGSETISSEIIKSRVHAKEGERFNRELVNHTSNALYGLNAFDSVLIGVDRKFYNVVPVDITIKEKRKPYAFEAGLGYDTYVGSRVHSSLTKYNFLGDAQSLSLSLAWSQLEQLAVMKFYKPVVFNLYGYYIGMGSELGYSNLEYDGFQEEKSFFRGYLDHQTYKMNLKLGLALETINITAVDNLDPDEDLEFAVNEGNFVLSYPYVDFIYDGRDSKLNPKYGYYLHFYGELGYSDEESSAYQKMLLEGRLIHTFGDLTLATVMIAGVVDEVKENSLPESKYFFAGGSFSNRAYGFRQLGVILSPTEDSIYGASTWGNLSLEADYPIVGDLYGAVFTDNTMLTEGSYDFQGEIITSVGTGVRYMTPIGPFKLDVGFNVADFEQYGISFQIGQSF